MQVADEKRTAVLLQKYSPAMMQGLLHHQFTSLFDKCARDVLHVYTTAVFGKHVIKQEKMTLKPSGHEMHMIN